VASARGKADESEILEVPADRFHQALAEMPAVSEPIVRAFIMRRQRLKRDREFAGLRILLAHAVREMASNLMISGQESYPASVCRF